VTLNINVSNLEATATPPPGGGTMAREAWLRDGYAILPQIVPAHLLPALRAAAEAVCGVAEATLPDAECQLDPSVLVMQHPELQGPVRELAGFALHGNTLGKASELLGVGTDGGAEAIALYAMLMVRSPPRPIAPPEPPGQPSGTDPRNWHRAQAPTYHPLTHPPTTHRRPSRP